MQTYVKHVNRTLPRTITHAKARVDRRSVGSSSVSILLPLTEITAIRNAMFVKSKRRQQRRKSRKRRTRGTHIRMSAPGANAQSNLMRRTQKAWTIHMTMEKMASVAFKVQWKEEGSKQICICVQTATWTAEPITLHAIVSDQVQSIVNQSFPSTSSTTRVYMESSSAINVRRPNQCEQTAKKDVSNAKTKKMKQSTLRSNGI